MTHWASELNIMIKMEMRFQEIQFLSTLYRKVIIIDSIYLLHTTPLCYTVASAMTLIFRI